MVRGFPSKRARIPAERSTGKQHLLHARKIENDSIAKRTRLLWLLTQLRSLLRWRIALRKPFCKGIPQARNAGLTDQVIPLMRISFEII